MRLLSKTFIFLLTGFALLFSNQLKAQDSDDLFAQARNAAFNKKDYPLAIHLSNRALILSPDYNDIRIFLGRVYTWSDKLDSARIEFEKVLKQEPGHEDASFAYASLEYWNDASTKALKLINNGLKKHPESKDLLLLKGKVLNSLREYQEAERVISKLLKNDPKNTEARAIADRIKDNSAQNKVGISYDFVHFDKQFEDPWHLTSIDYSRQTKFGSVTGRVNYANRFKTDGLQFELDAYPKISPTFYTYTSVGYSADGIFPNYRAGFSLYANLPASFEADAGFRFLNFGDNTWIYTLSAGKYYKNYWFNLRTYLTPSVSALSHSYSMNVRYYYGGADNYVKFGVGTGLSPDESSNNFLIGGVAESNTIAHKFKSSNVTLGFVHAFKTFNVLSASVNWLNQEYRKDTFGIQGTVSIGYQRRF
ncbi:MAG: YaiO family outer membrane beta-barrel protein [Sphingobacteriaceae bacterium]